MYFPEPVEAPFASLCVLAYKRLELLEKCLKSIRKTADYPYELIVNLDATDDEISSFLYSQYQQGLISKLILSNGKNRGVGRAFQNCLGMVEGQYIFKIDADLIFQPNWLSSTINILEKDSTIGAIGLFDYNKWDPIDERFKPENNVIYNKGDYQIVNDFVSSIYGFRNYDLQYTNKNIPDDGFHQELKRVRSGLNNGTGVLALKHLVDNTAFGVTKSTYVSGTMDHPFKTPTHNSPLIFS